MNDLKSEVKSVLRNMAVRAQNYEQDYGEQGREKAEAKTKEIVTGEKAESESMEKRFSNSYGVN